MEAPPTSISAVATVAAASSNYPDSISSSPRSRQTDSWDGETPNSSVPQKLRLMCSYGGHIIPRPHDKSLCYVGGDTRIIVIDRKTSLSDLHNRLSRTLLHNQPFSLKYQLPNEDLDSLISVTTEEDLENMVDEYDRLNNAGGGLKPGRLRLFLFSKSWSMEQVLVETGSIKSEDWFLNALNGVKANTLSVAGSSHGFSESSSVNCLLGLDDGLLGKSGVVKGVESQLEGAKSSGNANRNGHINQDVHSVPGSPMLENSSSFGSTSSSHSMANLPPIRVRVREGPKVGELGIDEHFQQMSVGAIGVGGNLNLPRPKPEVGAFVGEGVVLVPDTVAAGLPPIVGEEYTNLVISDDERTDHGGYRKALDYRQQVQSQPQQIPQFQQKQAVANDLASPDSISSEGSATNPLSRQRQAIYQEQIAQIQSVNNRVNFNPADMKVLDPNNGMVQLQSPVQESGHVLPSQFDQSHPQLQQQQQFVHAGIQYIPAGAVPMTSYYPLYPSQQQHHPHPSMLHQQYPVYLMPARQAQTYNLPVQQQNYNELMPNSAPSSRPQTPSVVPPAFNNQARNAPPQPEMASGMYRTTAGAARQLVQVQHQPQFVGFSQIHHPSQSLAPTSSAANSTYAYEFTDPAKSNAQMYCTQPLPPQMVAQYQPLASAPAGALPEVSAQIPMENINNQVGISQP